MPFAYKQVELQKMEGCSRDTLYKHKDRFVPIYIKRGQGISKRYLSREDSLIYKAGLEATKQQRIKAFCELAFDKEFTGELPAVAMCIIGHYDDGRVFDKIYYQGEEVKKINKFSGLQTFLTKLKMNCYPPREDKIYIQELDERQLELFEIRLGKKRGYKSGSRIIIDGFGRKYR